MKTCKECGEMKSLDAFPKYRKTCKICVNISARQWYANNPEKNRLYYERKLSRTLVTVAKWRSANPERVKAARMRWKRQNRDQVNKSKVLCEARRRARENAVESSFSHEDWLHIVAHYNGKCAYCGRDGDNLQMDHMIPLAAGGTHTKDNVVPACRECNQRKGARPLEEWLAMIASSTFSRIMNRGGS